MSWKVEYTDEFREWWDGLNTEEQESIDEVVGALATKGPMLPFPLSSGAPRRDLVNRGREVGRCTLVRFNGAGS